MRKELKRNLQSVLRSLRALSQKTEKMIKTLDKLEESQMAKKTKEKAKPKAKAMKKAPEGKIADGKKAKPTGADTVLSIIKRSKKGIDTDGLKKKTGFEGRKVGDII